MILSIFYFILAAFGLGILIFIHELGHYFMAKRVGMRVEAFGIGFGKPLFSWERKGVKWNICCLPFGGYVRIAGMEKEGTLEPHQIPDGFFGKPPLARIKVALAGPLVNIVFALLLFAIIWVAGGREKSFSEFTHLIGWVDPQSELYQNGVRPGDEIAKYDARPFSGFNDLAYASILKEKTAQISGYKINFETQQKEPFNYILETYADPRSVDPSMHTIGVLSPARYLIYRQAVDGSPMEGSGIQLNDRVLWADGELIFSMLQLSHVINEPKTLLTVQRGKERFLTRIPRLKASDLRMSDSEQAELRDWQHEMGLKGKWGQLFFIPYNLSHEGVVESSIPYLNAQSKEQVYTPNSRTGIDAALQKGDRIIAVDGTPIASASQLLSRLQERQILIIVQREKQWPITSWKNEDQTFIASIRWNELQKIASTIGSSSLTKESDDLHLLQPVTPKPLTELSFYSEKKAWYAQELSERKKAIEEIKNPEERSHALQFLEENQNRLALGIIPQDLAVSYNPSPISLFFGVFDQMWRTLKSLVTGYLSPKWMSGPVGIVQVFHYGWTVGVKEALFWIAVISLNLGIVNLFPVPVLDGGHILLALVESVTKKPLKAKTMERLIIPFIVLIIAAFVYFTYNDILRLFF